MGMKTLEATKVTALALAGPAVDTDGDGNPNGTDMDCDGFVDAADFTPFFLEQFVAGAPGPSGLPCAGVVICM